MNYDSLSKRYKRVRKAVIIAAGRGIRINEHSQEIPKSLISVGNQSIIEIILKSLAAAGIEQVLIVTGYKHEILQARLGNGERYNLSLQYIYNKHWMRSNGLSVLAAKPYVREDEQFLLMMSDHLFEQKMLHAVLGAQFAENELILAVDTKVNKIFDIDDATKVVVDGNKIKAISKELQSYNGIDCGLFKCTFKLFNALEDALIDGDCSLSDGCQKLIDRGKMAAADIANAFWIDIDTPASLAFAIGKILPEVENG